MISACREIWGLHAIRAKEYIESYFARYSTVHDYMNGLVEEARRTGESRTMFGRLRTLPEISSKNFMRRSFAERTAMNTPIQGSAADIIKLAMNAVQKEIGSTEPAQPHACSGSR